MSKCGFDKAWIGPCQNDQPCSDHAEKVCESCGSPATRECSETGAFVCGVPLCDDCEHTICSDGTNGMGMSARLRPPGLGSHCKKSRQVFLPWYARKEADALEA